MQVLDFFKYSSTKGKLLQLVSVSLFLGIISLAIAIPLFGRDFNDPNVIRAYQFLQTLAVFVLPPLFLSFVWYGKITENLQLKKLPRLSSVFHVVLIMLVSVPAINLLSELNKAIVFPDFLKDVESYLLEKESAASELTHLLLQSNQIEILLLNIFIVAILPALGEELYFRGIIQKLFHKWGKHVAIWIAAVVFSAVHMQFFGFLPRMLFGAVFGYFFLWSSNLWYPIIAHFVNNALVVVAFYFLNPIGNFEIIEQLGTTNAHPWLGVASLLLSIGLIFQFKKRFT